SIWLVCITKRAAISSLSTVKPAYGRLRWSSTRSRHIMSTTLPRLNQRSGLAGRRGSPPSLLLCQRLLGWNFRSVGVDVVDVEGGIRGEESGARGNACELMHVFTRHHGVSGRSEHAGRATF